MSIILDFDRTISFGAIVQVFTASYNSVQWGLSVRVCNIDRSEGY